MTVSKRIVLAALAAVLIAGLVAVGLDRSELDEEVLRGTLGGIEAERAQAIGASADAAPRWLGPNDEPVPLRTDEEVLDFLATADVVSSEPVGEGVTRPLRVLLEKEGGLRLRAIFRYGVVDREKVRLQGRIHMKFRDRFVHEKAAYELARLLGLG